LPVQYWRWLSAVAHGDFGEDYTGLPVIETLKVRLPATILLITSAYLVQELIALPLGLLGALKRYSLYDHVLTCVSYVGLALPTFWLGLMLILVFAVTLGWFPPGGIVNPSTSIPPFGTAPYWVYLLAQPAEALGDLLTHLLLPVATLAVIGIGTDSRFMRASMLDVIGLDYVRTARAKGLPQHTVVLKHALRNALLPIITNAGLFIPTLVSGAIITETIFGWPGMGQYFISALGNHDTNTLQVVLLLSALFVLIGNLVADLMYAWVDPRIRYD
jgi:peptide/nickel transport system permease protein